MFVQRRHLPHHRVVHRPRRVRELALATVVIQRHDTNGRDSHEPTRSITQGSVGLHACRSRNSLRILICRVQAAIPKLPCDRFLGEFSRTIIQLDAKLIAGHAQSRLRRFFPKSCDQADSPNSAVGTNISWFARVSTQNVVLS